MRRFSASFYRTTRHDPTQKIDRDRYSKPATDAPHELAGAVNLIQKLGLVTETYDYPYWLKKVHEANFDYLEEEVKKAPPPRSD